MVNAIKTGQDDLRLGFLVKERVKEGQNQKQNQIKRHICIVLNYEMGNLLILFDDTF